MKRLFSKISKNSAGSAKPSAPEPPPIASTLTAKTGLQPSYVVPPVPHPNPHEHIALLASEDGLLIRPHVGTESGLPHPASHVRLSWSKTVDIAELPSDGGDRHIDWKESVIVYGIVGLMTLFNGNKTSSFDYTK